MKHKIAISVVLAVLILTGCKTTKTIAKTEIKQQANPIAQVILQIQNNQPHFKTANVSKMSLGLDVNDRKLNVSATCKIRKDSAIFLSIQPFMGIELFKAELTTDSMRVFDKMNHRYYIVDYSFFQKRFGVNVDFNSFQSLLTAQFFCVGKKDVQTDSCKLTPLTNGLNEIDFNTTVLTQSTTISAANIIQQVILKTTNSNYQLQTDYSEYAVLNGVSFPQKIVLQVNGQKAKNVCEFSILKVDFNTDLKFVNTNPDRYTKGDIEQLLKK